MVMDFEKAKKVYSKISARCLYLSVENTEKDSFRVFDNILNICNNVLMSVCEEDRKNDEDVDEEIKKLNEAIYKVYFEKTPRDDDYIRDDRERCFLCEWKEGEDAYRDLKRFANQSMQKKELNYDKVVELFRKVLDVLNNEVEPVELEMEVKELFEPYYRL